MRNNQVYDYIIVGAGASGCVLANRLSANPETRVLLIEAGGSDAGQEAIRDPAGFVSLWGSGMDWQLETTSQEGLSGRRILINQGKVLGGGTSINAMMYVRGNPANFAQWKQMGADGWGYEDVLPYFKKLEKFEEGPSALHGSTGELSVRDCPDEVMRSEHFLEGAVQLGYDGPHWDYNGVRQENGVGLLQFHIDQDGNRHSSVSAFIAPVKDRENLSIWTNCQVTRVLIENKTAFGIEFQFEDQLWNVLAEKEVIISAGALASPKLLLLSGIGPAEDLEALGISVNVDLPGVGKNLQDHLQLPMIFRSKIDLPHTTLLTGNVLFIKTQDDKPVADLQLNFTPSIPKPLEPILPDLGGPACIFLPILVQPESRGEVKLASADPLAKPMVDPKYLTENEDIEILKKAVTLVRSLANTPKFLEMNGGELVPGENVDLEAFIKSQSTTIWHPAGTCRIGKDADAVVDPQLHVHGIARLRVADASVMPTVTSGNTVAACFMIGEKAADMILQEAQS